MKGGIVKNKFLLWEAIIDKGTFVLVDKEINHLFKNWDFGLLNCEKIIIEESSDIFEAIGHDIYTFLNNYLTLKDLKNFNLFYNKICSIYKEDPDFNPDYFLSFYRFVFLDIQKGIL